MTENKEFIVSARKYRPLSFRSVVGQRHITQTLQNAISEGHLAHAYLFTGPRGVGKTTCARIFAKAINCLNPTPEREACGECESCVAFAADRSFNIHEMDAASNNSVEDIRSLNDKVRVAPQIGRYSVYIIDEVHMLSSAAFNAFLKTLEEPPAHAIFVLATTEKHKILPTILSRCQIYDFNRIRVEDIFEYLRYIAECEGVASDDESLHIIAQRADGGMRDALSTFDRVVSFCGRELRFSEVAESLGVLDFKSYFSVMEMASRGDFGGMLLLYNRILSGGFDGNHFLSGLGNHLRNLLVARNPQTFSLLEMSGNVAESYRSVAQGCDVGVLFSAINLVSVAEAGYKVASSRRLHVELVLMKLAGLVATDVSAPRVAATPLPKVVEGAAPQPVAPQPAPQPVAVPVPQPAPAPTPAPQPVTPATPSLGFSINSVQKKSPDVTPKEVKAEVPQLSHSEGVAILHSRFSELIALWESRQKPRTALALSSARIEDSKIVLSVPNELMQSEIERSMVDIDRDMLALFGFKLPLEIVVVEEVVVDKPVTIQQKLERLAAKNSSVLELREALDLTL